MAQYLQTGAFSNVLRSYNRDDAINHIQLYSPSSGVYSVTINGVGVMDFSTQAAAETFVEAVVDELGSAFTV